MKRLVRTLLPMALTLVSTTASLALFADAVAQPASVKLSPGAELQPVYATPQDVAEGKRVAEKSCVSCHGVNGISATKGTPHLAGQRPAYLFLELKAYQVGARSDPTMTAAVKFLSDDALVKVAAYYAGLDPAQPTPAATPKAGVAKPDPVQAGKAAAAGCAGCHGEIGVSKTPGMPSLTGLDPKYLVAAMKAYKDGQRKNDMMKTFLSALSDADLNNIALFYALQKPARAKTPVEGDAAAGKSAAPACASCHGEQGVSSGAANPSLAGQDAQYLVAALQAYKGGTRSDEAMKGLASALDEAAIRNLSAYYAKLEPRAPNVRKPMSIAELAVRCDRCHGVDGNAGDPRLPAIAAQRVDYLENVLRAYQTGARKSSAMSAMSQALSDSEVESLAAHYASKKARAVIYITLPAK